MSGTDDEDLKINTLHRFAKQSSRLVLHEYSHCEIPAGCGGVILRWIDPRDGEPGRAQLTAYGRVWLDGKELASSVTLIAPGDHVVAMDIEPAENGDDPVWAFELHYDSDDEIDLVQRGGARWRARAKADAIGEWWKPAYDDAAWTAMPAASREAIAALENWPRRRLEQAMEHGALVWRFHGCVRVSFRVPERTT